MAQVKFNEVKGYATYSTAQKQGEKVAATFKEKQNVEIRWVVLALETGRFVPAFLYGDKSDWQPMQVASYPNCVVMNA